MPKSTDETEPYDGRSLRGEVIAEFRVDQAWAAVWRERRSVIRITTVCVFLAVIYLLGSRSEYTSEATLIPEKQGQGNLSIPGIDLLQQFGGLLGGLDASNLTGKADVIPAQLYPDILASSPVLTGLLDRPVIPVSRTESMPLRVYLDSHKPFSLWEFLAGGASEVVSLVSLGRTEGEPIRGDSLIVQMTRDDWDQFKDLDERLMARLDSKQGVLHISATMPDPILAATVCSDAVRALTAFATRYRVDKLNRDLSFVRSRFEESSIQFNRALDRLAEFQDQNQNLSRSAAQADEQRLQAEYDVAFSVYNTLANRFEEAQIKVQEQTPVFQILQPAMVPLRRSSPQRVMTLFLGLMVGLILSGGFVLLTDRGHGREPLSS